MTYELLQSDYREFLALGDFQKVEWRVDDLLEKEGITLEKDSLPYRKLSKEMLKANIEFLSKAINMRKVDFGEEPDIRTARRIRFRNPQVSSETLSAVLQKFWNEHEATWSIGTRDDYRNCQRILLRIVKDVPIASIDFQTMREYKDKVAKLPKFLNRQKVP